MLARLTAFRFPRLVGRPDPASAAPPPGDGPGGMRLSTFAGVFTPTVLTILGAIMYLRMGWVVGNAGLLGGILIILLSHVITVTTGMAVASIATNIRVGAGGAFAIIAQSLGLEVGGSIGVPLFIAQTVSVALYVLAFTEGWLRVFPGQVGWLVAVVTLGVVFVISYASTRFATRIQSVILVIVVLSLGSIGMGSFAIGGHLGMQHAPQLWGRFAEASFWETFAIFFPAVTGIMAGISLSGQLENPRRSIPRGTLSAIAITMVVYLVLAYWFARVASPEELTTNFTIVVDRAFVGWIVLAGILGATFSSALGSLVAAPRVLQALGAYRILPKGGLFARETASGEARNALLLTSAIAFGALLIALASGGLDAIAPLITMFFLLTYTMLNVVVLIEQRLDMVSFRPTFRVPWVVPFVGMLSCLFTMLLVNPVFGFLAVVFALGLYGFLLQRRLPSLEKGDVRSGLFNSVARWAARKADSLPAATERTWRPSILVPVRSTDELMGSYRLLRALVRPKGAVRCVGVHEPGDQSKVADLNWMIQGLSDEGVDARCLLLEHENFARASQSAMELLSAIYFRPNLLFLSRNSLPRWSDLQHLLAGARAARMGVVILYAHPAKALGRERLINVWLRQRSAGWSVESLQGHQDLALLLAYQLACGWRGRIHLCTAVAEPGHRELADSILSEILELARLGGMATFASYVGTFPDVVDQAPVADLSVLGLTERPTASGLDALVERINGTCIFVQSSGEESIFA